MLVVAWELLGAVPSRELVDARLVLHHAAQLVAAVGRSLVPPRSDDGHTSLQWVDGIFVGEPVAGPSPWHAALRPSDLSLSVVRDGELVGGFGLAGRTRDEAFAWLSGVTQTLGVEASRLKVNAPYTIPDHPIGAGAPFPSPKTRGIEEVTRWFVDGDALVRTVAATWPGAAAVRVWPHHFDVGSVLPLGPPHDGEAPSIGIGLSPGDEAIAEPYLYATLWPAPKPESLPALPSGGRWNREGWTGAVLIGSEISGVGDGAAQSARASEFLTRAVELLRDVHGRR